MTWYWGVGSGTSSQRIAGFLVGWLLTGIHTAGPNLTPKTFVQGLYSNPPRGGALEGAPTSLVVYGPGPKLPYNGYAGIGLDFAPYWWGTETTGPSNGLGTVAKGVGWYVDGGKRYVAPHGRRSSSPGSTRASRSTTSDPPGPSARIRR